jgi:dTDP-glucose 4,6-dehydratase
VTVSNCSNNYGPFQHPEKLIPVVILNALHGRPIPIYGDGGNVRDWLYVDDHVDALGRIVARGAVGESYNIGGGCELTNLDLAETICARLDLLRPRAAGRYADLIEFVADRPGHDRRYAVDSAKIARDLGWSAATSLADGLDRTIRWYLGNEWWWRPLTAVERAAGTPLVAAAE